MVHSEGSVWTYCAIVIPEPEQGASQAKCNKFE